MALLYSLVNSQPTRARFRDRICLNYGAPAKADSKRFSGRPFPYPGRSLGPLFSSSKFGLLLTTPHNYSYILPSDGVVCTACCSPFFALGQLCTVPRHIPPCRIIQGTRNTHSFHVSTHCVQEEYGPTSLSFSSLFTSHPGPGRSITDRIHRCSTLYALRSVLCTVSTCNGSKTVTILFRCCLLIAGDKKYNSQMPTRCMLSRKTIRNAASKAHGAPLVVL